MKYKPVSTFAALLCDCHLFIIESKNTFFLSLCLDKDGEMAYFIITGRNTFGFFDRKTPFSFTMDK